MECTVTTVTVFAEKIQIYFTCNLNACRMKLFRAMKVCFLNSNKIIKKPV